MAASSRSITLQGTINGVYRVGSPGSCGPGDTLVTGTVGPNPARDYADMTVSDSGSIELDAPQRGGTFRGSGVSFRPGSGWDIDAVLRGSGDSQVHVVGHLPC